MRLKVNEGWEPGITWGDKTYRPGETFDIDEDDARQFLDNGSAAEAPGAKPERSRGASAGSRALDRNVRWVAGVPR
jgi:hypothetical protein